MWTFLLTLAAAVALVHSHGRVLDPPGRGTAWRLGYNARANYDDDGLFCGGFYHQHTVNGGNCGLCGDPYDEARPRAHERGGIYDSGIITGTYESGAIITIAVEITAHHMGYWEFKICPDIEEPNQECFDDNVLELEEGGTRYYPTNGASLYKVNYRLPEGLVCEICTLQWRYTCGNNWGTCNNGTQGLGCGNQENFGACSDISIVGNPEAPQYVPVDSLLLQDLEKIDRIRTEQESMRRRHSQSQSRDVIRLLLSNIKLPGRHQPNKNKPAKQRVNSKKPHSKLFLEPQKKQKHRKRNKPKKKKKKSKPFKAKWMSSWG